VWVFAEVERRVEQRVRIAPFVPAGLQIVEQRIEVRRRDVPIEKVERRVEEGVRVVTAKRANHEIVQQRSLQRGGDVRGGTHVRDDILQVERFIEQTAVLDESHL